MFVIWRHLILFSVNSVFLASNEHARRSRLTGRSRYKKRAFPVTLMISDDYKRPEAGTFSNLIHIVLIRHRSGIKSGTDYPVGGDIMLT